MFSTALEAFKIDSGRYPTSIEGLDALVARPKEVESWNGPYILRLRPILDPWGRPYQYTLPGTLDQGGFDIVSLGKDGIPNTADDLTARRARLPGSKWDADGY
jgi:general secretion pathway protein G